MVKDEEHCLTSGHTHDGDTQGEFIGKPMSTAANLAVILRKAQWELDQVAYRLPKGDVSVEERGHLADILITLAGLLRDHDI